MGSTASSSMANGTSVENSRRAMKGSELHAMDKHEWNEDIEFMDTELSDV